MSSVDRTGNHLAACILAAFGWALVSGIRLGRGPLMMSARGEIDFSETQLALIGLIATGATVVAAIPLGLFADRGSLRQLPAVAGIALTCLASIVRYFGASSGAFFVAAALEGIAYPMLVIAVVSMIAQLPLLARGALIGGALAAMTVVQSMLLTIGGLSGSVWRGTTVATAVVALSLMVALVLVGQSSNRPPVEDEHRRLADVAGFHLVASQCLMWFAVVGSFSFATSFVIRSFGLTVPEVAAGFGVVGLGTTVLALTGGVLTAWLIGVSRAAACVLLAVAAVFVTLFVALGTTSDDASTAMTLLAFVSPVGTFAFACCLTAIACQLPPGKRGMFTGIVLAWMGVVQYTAPAMTGMLSDLFAALGSGEGLRRAIQVTVLLSAWAFVHAVVAWSKSR